MPGRRTVFGSPQPSGSGFGVTPPPSSSPLLDPLLLLLLLDVGVAIDPPGVVSPAPLSHAAAMASANPPTSQNRRIRSMLAPLETCADREGAGSAENPAQSMFFARKNEAAGATEIREEGAQHI
jgi:hypothetical protein